MMSKLWIALALIFLTAFTAQKVYALFSDSVTMTTSLTIATGEVSFDIEDLVSKPISSEGLKPGEWTPEGTLNLVNKPGSIPLKTYMYIDNLDGAICGDVNLKLEGEFDGVRYPIYEGDLEELNGENDSVELTITELSVLAPGETLKIYQSAQLDEEADHNTEGEECIWDEVFVGVSSAGEDDD